ncbi:IMV membrane protein [Nile crocodilepox virus]|uniref:IMV membrane protein n=1 Tax=Nile crocodilepox virus (isolate Crocodylus niloticus/Zimbabwe/Ume/2001) TaxID=1289473 RepID=Q070B5_CPRVZ|nr:IMV membrane protein [Nile crocodilepox virus]ABJ09027.1 IMV membrane protein [Nile crocodilepox virus]
MGMLEFIVRNYSTIFYVGLGLLILAIIFAFFEFSRSGPSEKPWKAASIVCFILGMAAILSTVLGDTYYRRCRITTSSKEDLSERLNNLSEFQLNSS